jgi:hypothetical protein
VFGELIGAERPRKKPALVVVGFDVDDGDTVDIGAGVLQKGPPERMLAGLSDVERLRLIVRYPPGSAPPPKYCRVC